MSWRRSRALRRKHRLCDEQLGVLVEELARQEASDDTRFIVLSDHGEHFGNMG
jgi:arylsulfatase A-like enzyme